MKRNYTNLKHDEECKCPTHKGVRCKVAGDRMMRKGNDNQGRAKYWCEHCNEGK